MKDLNFILALVITFAAKTAKLDKENTRSLVLSIFSLLDCKTEFTNKDVIAAGEIFDGALQLQEYRKNFIEADKNVSPQTAENIEETKKH